MDDAAIVPFFETLRAANPEPASELEYASVLELLAAVLLSAQATDPAVNQPPRPRFSSPPPPHHAPSTGGRAPRVPSHTTSPRADPRAARDMAAASTGRPATRMTRAVPRRHPTATGAPVSTDGTKRLSPAAAAATTPRAQDIT